MLRFLHSRMIVSLWEDREAAPVGAWVRCGYSTLHGEPVMQVRDVDLESLYLPELDSTGRLAPEKRGYVPLYRQRRAAGELPPRMYIVQMEDGRLRVVDGHRRALASIEAGFKHGVALVSPLVATADGLKEMTLEMLRGEALNECIAAPHESQERPRPRG